MENLRTLSPKEWQMLLLVKLSCFFVLQKKISKVQYFGERYDWSKYYTIVWNLFYHRHLVCVVTKYNSRVYFSCEFHSVNYVSALRLKFKFSPKAVDDSSKIKPALPPQHRLISSSCGGRCWEMGEEGLCGFLEGLLPSCLLNLMTETFPGKQALEPTHILSPGESINAVCFRSASGWAAGIPPPTCSQLFQTKDAPSHRPGSFLSLLERT